MTKFWLLCASSTIMKPLHYRPYINTCPGKQVRTMVKILQANKVNLLTAPQFKSSDASCLRIMKFERWKETQSFFFLPIVTYIFKMYIRKMSGSELCIQRDVTVGKICIRT